MEVQPKDSSKGYFYVSLAKSTLRKCADRLHEMSIINNRANTVIEKAKQ